MHGQNFNFIYFLMGIALGLFLNNWDIDYIDYDNDEKEDEDDFSKQKEKEEKQNKKNS